MATRKWAVGETVGGMTIRKFLTPYRTTRGLQPRYVCTCCNCGREKELTQDALRKRSNTGAIKCYSCSQERVEGRRLRRESPDYKTGYELNVPIDLYKLFMTRPK
jgi:hypothetical protein